MKLKFLTLLLPAGALTASTRGLAQSIQGVTISVSPSALLRQEKDGEELTWGLLLGFRKEKALTKRGGRAVADLLRGALAQANSSIPGRSGRSAA